MSGLLPDVLRDSGWNARENVMCLKSRVSKFLIHGAATWQVTKESWCVTSRYYEAHNRIGRFVAAIPAALRLAPREK